MPKFLLLVSGNQMRLKFIYVRKFLLLTNVMGRKLRSVKGCGVYVMLIHLPSFPSWLFWVVLALFYWCMSCGSDKWLPHCVHRCLITLNILVAKHQLSYLNESVMLARRFRQVVAFMRVLSQFFAALFSAFVECLRFVWLSGMLAKMVQTRGCRFVCIPIYSLINNKV